MNVQTLVFLDVKTTGLPFAEGNQTKITEMCLVAVQTEHISLGVFPRVLNKLSFCCNPLKTIAPMCKDLTGLTNALLENQSSFQKNTVETIKNFLGLQIMPLCLVAHNGNNFDYPILLAEVYNAKSSLPDDILCIDSLQAFRELDRQNFIEELDVHDLPTQVNEPVEFSDGFDEMLFNIAEEVETSECQLNKVQQTNETTPSKKMKLYITDYFINTASTSNINDVYYMPNGTTRNYRDSNGAKNKKQSSNLNWGKSLTSSHAQSSCRRQSFKLTEVYSRLTNKQPIQSYKAENDCMMLIECAAKIGQGFINWANKNVRKLSDVPMMQPGRKFGQ